MTLRSFLPHLALALLLACSSGARAQLAPPTEDEVKAAFLYKFLDFVRWPPDGAMLPAIAIGVMGDDGVETALRRYVELRRERGPTVAVRSIAAAEQADNVQMVFVGRRESSRIARVLAAVKNRPVLLVTDGPDMLERGSMINFVVTDRVRFEIALDNATQAGLHLNARLLAVAVRVKKSEGLFQQTLFAHGLAPTPSWRLPCFARGFVCRS